MCINWDTRGQARKGYTKHIPVCLVHAASRACFATGEGVSVRYVTCNRYNVNVSVDNLSVAAAANDYICVPMPLMQVTMAVIAVKGVASTELTFAARMASTASTGTIKQTTTRNNQATRSRVTMTWPETGSATTKTTWKNAVGAETNRPHKHHGSPGASGRRDSHDPTCVYMTRPSIATAHYVLDMVLVCC